MATKMTREEAIKIVQSATVWTDEERDALAMLIPELAESEDEKIRKWIITELKDSLHEIETMYSGDYDNRDEEDKKRQEYLNKALTYLEKQKECASNNFDDVWNEEDCEDIIAEGQKLTPRFKELLKEVCHAWYDRGAKLEKQKEQKPAEVDESTKRLNDNWIKQHFDEYTEQKPAEWSEEDRNTLLMAATVLKANFDSDEKFEDCDYDCETLAGKLLEMRYRASPSWKPSDEQLRPLEYAIDYFKKKRNDTTYLESLYNDLKKLM